MKLWCIHDNSPKNTDCFIVLSYGAKSKNEPVKPTKAAIALAVKWWKKFPKSKIIMSTGYIQKLDVPNSKVMADYAIKLGVPKQQIIEEDKSLNTYENLLYSKLIVEKNNYKRLTLVTYDLHARRALAIAKKLGFENIYHVSAFSKGEMGPGIRYFYTRSRIEAFIYEILAYVYNKIKKEL